MLHETGYASLEEMFSHIPDEVMLKEGVNIPSGLNEQTIKARMEGIAGRNVVFRHIFKRAGAYNHHTPTVISSATSKKEFIAACTPYQAEISQGILQSIFEYQTMLCEPTGMDASNASIHDGATAAAEVATMCKERKKTTAYISVTANPDVIEVMKTYCFGSNTKVVMALEKDGVVDGVALEEILKTDPQAACFYVQQPNYYGDIEGRDALGRIVHETDAKYIMGCNPMTLAVAKIPAECGADIAMGDGQLLDMPLAPGGSYLGFMTATVTIARKFPGRIADEVADYEGRRALVLTLQAREQHIHHEKTSSSMCFNQAWCVLTVSVYMTAMEANDMIRTADQCMSRAHYLRDVLEEAGFEPKHNYEFFHEFITVSPGGGCTDSAHILRALESEGTLDGLPLSDREILWCAMEMNTRGEMDELAFAIRGALHRECGQKKVRGS